MQQTELKTVGVREFREHLTALLMSEDPIAITKHGLTVGYYIPTHHPVSKADRESLKAATQVLQQLLDEQGIDAEQLIEEAKALRRQSKKAHAQNASA